jgi:uncharacterized phage-associated protein
LPDLSIKDCQRRSRFDPSIVVKKTRTFLNDAWNVYGQFSARKLRNMTHEECKRPVYAALTKEARE